MKKYLLLSGLFVLFCLMLSCKNTPTTPDPPAAPTITAVTVTSTNSTIWIGQTEQMTATVTMSDGTTKAATGTWGSDNTNVATVDQSGLVTGIATGEATIYIDTTNNQSGLVTRATTGETTILNDKNDNQSGLVTRTTTGETTILSLRGTKKLSVKKSIPTVVTVTSNRSEIWVGETEQMTATVTMDDGTTKEATGNWGTDKKKVATVSQSGLVTGIDAGDVTIWFRLVGDQYAITTQTMRGTKILTVRKHVPTSVAVTSYRSTIMVGEREQMYARVTMSDGSKMDATGKWSTTNSGVASIDQSGLVRGNAQGNVTIRFETVGDQYGMTVQGVVGSKTLTVNAPEPPKPMWSHSGTGDMVFNMPSYVRVVRVTGTYSGYAQNFIVYVDGWLLVNELMGTGFSQTYFSGTYLTSGGVVEIKSSSGVAWTFTQVNVTTALTNTTREITDIPSPSDPRYRAYEIYRRVAAGKK